MSGTVSRLDYPSMLDSKMVTGFTHSMMSESEVCNKSFLIQMLKLRGVAYGISLSKRFKNDNAEMDLAKMVISES